MNAADIVAELPADAVEEEVIDPAVDEEPVDEEPVDEEPVVEVAPSADLIAVAESMGYKEGGVLGPAEFIRREREINNTMRGTITHLKKEITNQGKLLAGMAKTQSTTVVEDATRELEELEAQKKAAFADGEQTVYDKLNERISALRGRVSEVQQLPAIVDTTTTAATVDTGEDFDDTVASEMDAWKTENKAWYGKDEDLTAFANGAYGIIQDKNPTWSNQNILDEISARVKKRAATSTRRTAAAVLPGGGRRTVQNPGKRTVADLTPSELRAARYWVGQGTHKTLQEYVDSMEAESKLMGWT